MSDDNSDNGHSDLESLTPSIDEERPLDSLLPEIDEPERVGDTSPVEKTAIHPRVLRVELEDGCIWSMACWEDPGMHELDEQLRRTIGSTLLAEMARPSGDPDLHERNFDAVELLVFAEMFPESRTVLGTLGFEEVDYIPDEYEERIDTWRTEAEEVEHDIAARPDSLWLNLFHRHGEEMDTKLDRVHRELDERLDGVVWGESPGGPSKFAADLLEREFNVSIEPTHEGLAQFELVTVQETGDYLRWMRPLIFQALCDFVGVLLQVQHGLDVQWGICEPEEDGFVPPPLFRVRRRRDWTTVNIARWMANWCLMPGDPSESDSLGERLGRKLDSL